jgi:iron complex transport system substrate-binding protein
VIAPRVVSLLPSATEIVCALGAGDTLVGVSHECDHPAYVRDRPVLTRSRVDAAGASRAIDAAVRGALHGAADALSVYTVDEAKLGALAPDLIVTQDLCEVCAVSLDDVASAVARLAHRAEGPQKEVRIVCLRPTRLADVLDDVERVAGALGRAEAGRALRAELAARMEATAVRARAASSRPRVVSLEWIDPIMLGGTWMPELVALAGGEPAGAVAGQPAPTVDAAALARLRPEVVVVKPCGFDLPRVLAEQEIVRRVVLPAVGPGARVYLTDGSAFFNRPGPRLVESLEILAACVHPELFSDLARKHAAVIHRL